MLIKRLLLSILLFTALVHFDGFSAESRDTTYSRISKIREPNKKVDAFNAATEFCWRSGKYEKGLQYAREALRIAEDNDYKKGQGDVLNNIGIIYDYQGKLSEALRVYFKALGIQESIGDQRGIAYTCSNIGLIYSNQRSYEKALQYHKRSLRIRKKLNFKSGISASYNNIGICYMYQKKYSQSLHNYFASVEIDKELGDEFGLSDSYSNIGVIYMEMDSLDKAERFLKLAVPYREKQGNLLGLATSYSNIGTLYYKRHNIPEALKWLEKSLEIGLSIGSKDNIKYCYEMLSKIEEEQGNFDQAFDFYKLYIAYGDSITNEKNTREQTQAEMQYDFDRKAAQQKLEQQRVRLILWSVVALAVIILIFSAFLYKRWKIAQSQQRLIEEKNRLVELKNQEILDSISYAKRIQSAILPPEKLVKEFLVNSFILYKPKDIVAGDFYWMEAHDDTIIFAAADCTGHGVPGALISVVCHNALNRSVREFGLIDPGAILDKTRDIIIEEFAKSEDDVNDGMDISLCALNTATLEVQWSGANNPLWVVRQRSNTIEELKANKQPIGRYSKYEAFQTHTLQLQKGDSLYLFTDGFADQFGGSDAKKYKSRNMKELILRVKDAPMDVQKRLFEDAFDAWKGDLEQVDDVCVLGIRV